MKKLLLILATVLSFSAVSAQYRDDGRYRDNYPTQTRDGWNNNNDRGRDYGYNNNNNRRYEQARRQAEYDRMNQQCDERINVYRNDRSLSSYERQRRIDQVERERQQKAKSFGKGLIVGGLAALVIGAIISN